MAKVSINLVKNYTQYLIRKNTNGNLSPEQFNLIINRASRKIFVERTGNPHQYQIGNPSSQMAFQITQKITEDLKIFQENANLILSAQGIVNYPTNLAYTIPGLSYVTSKKGKKIYVPIEIVDKDKEGYRLSSQIVSPTKSDPIAIFENTYIQVYPIGISNIRFPYLRYPKDAVWSYTLVNNRPEFDPVNSVDLEWEDLVINDIVIQALMSIGISIKDPNVLQFAQEQAITGA